MAAHPGQAQTEGRITIKLASANRTAREPNRRPDQGAEHSAHYLKGDGGPPAPPCQGPTSTSECGRTVLARHGIETVYAAAGGGQQQRPRLTGVNGELPWYPFVPQCAWSSADPRGRRGSADDIPQPMQDGFGSRLIPAVNCKVRPLRDSAD